MTHDLNLLAFDHAPIGLIFAEDRVIRACNRQFARVFGFWVAELINRPLSDLYPTIEDYHRIGDLGLRKMQGSGRYQDERIMRRRDGSHFWCRVRGQSLDPDTPFSRAVWSFEDISDHRPLTEMTPRERQVATKMVEGLTSKEIARELGILPRTVDVHRARLLDKFEARNSLELVARLTGLPL